jgi:hypothetical protein
VVPSLTSTASVDRGALVAAGHELIEFTTLRREVVALARRVDGRRESIDNPPIYAATLESNQPMCV